MTEIEAKLEAAHAALDKIKKIALNVKPKDVPAELAHIVRICIDARR